MALRGMNPGQLFPLINDSTILGRHPDCDIVLEVGAVSRQHARIVRVGVAFFVEDLHSRNGTFVNDDRVEGRRRLVENDQIKICDLVFVFHLGSPEQVAASQEPPHPRDAIIIVDDEKQASGSTIMSKFDVGSATIGSRLAANPEAKLKALLDIGRNLGGTVRLGDVLPRLLDNLFAIFLQADRGFIVLKDPATGKLIPKAVKHRREGPDEQIRISRTIVSGVMNAREAVLSADAATDARFDMSESVVDFHIHSMMCVPLVGSTGDVLGVIQIDTADQRRRFGRDDLEVLASVACQAAVAVENAQLHEVAVQEELFQRELGLAHKVQQGLLPATPPKLPRYEFFDYYEPANHLGGDYFDYIPLPGNRLAAALADVSGKGISAALLMARLSAEVRYSLAILPTPRDALARMNAFFCESRWEDRFVTLAIAVLDPARNEITVVNAGHMPPLLRRSTGSIEAIGADISGLPLGIEAKAEYGQVTVAMEPGDTLILYTDGITDAMNAPSQLYGGKRLQAQIAKPFAHVAALGQSILTDIRRFVGGQPQNDDMCITCMQRTT
jgi:serine phosphatase RsbU (regulator of sigma subunit)